MIDILVEACLRRRFPIDLLLLIRFSVPKAAEFLYT